ncbi:nucleotidyltransferase domain-containing protein [Spirochaeta lutea]|uniref:Polymerase nucleotidyl transferase domain-containing protein n=1 Tax=Spirochaeta lutea TaxID=1480694 RepID=A0A098QYV6_9SPIO|nr:nucleotidyltransferase domain-containing protein [Spirochaeta lutea]KGE72804.1 hypothetical protein DC28_06150 [Spirochaeta lutea]
MSTGQDQIQSIVSKLINEYHPQEIYLYGSFAWGEPNEDSDIDFCIILPDSKESQADRIRRGLYALKGEKCPVDLLVLTVDEIAERKNHPSTLIYRVINEGVKLYAAA